MSLYSIPRTRTWPHMFPSLVVHACLLSMVFLVAKSQTQHIQKVDRLRKEEWLAKQEEEKQRDQEMQLELQREEFKDEVRKEFDEIIEQNQDISEIRKDEVQDAIDEFLENTVPDAEKLSELSEEQKEEEKAELQEKLKDEIVETLEDLRLQVILEYVRTYTKTKVAPRVKKRIEEELVKRGSSKNGAGRDIQAAANKQAEALVDEARKQVRESLDPLKLVAREQDIVAKKSRKTPDQVAQKQKAVRSNTRPALKSAYDALDTLSKISTKSRKAADALQAEILKARDPLDKQQEIAHSALDKGDGKAASGPASSASRTLNNLVKRVEELLKGKGINRRETEDLQNDIARKAITKVRDPLREKVKAEVVEKAVPKATEEVTGKVENQIKSAGYQVEQVHDRLRDTVKTALLEALADIEIESEKLVEKEEEKLKDDKAEEQAEVDEKIVEDAAEKAAKDAIDEIAKEAAEAIDKAVDKGVTEKTPVDSETMREVTGMDNAQRQAERATDESEPTDPADRAEQARDKAQAHAETAKAAARQAETKAEEAKAKAEETAKKADEATEKAEKAAEKAEQAKAKAGETASDAAEKAAEKAEEAKAKAEDAKADAQEAAKKAEAAAAEQAEKAAEAKAAAETAEAEAAKAEQAAAEAQDAKKAADEAADDGEKAAETAKAEEAAEAAETAEAAAAEAAGEAVQAAAEAEAGEASQEAADAAAEAAGEAAEAADAQADAAQAAAEAAEAEASGDAEAAETAQAEAEAAAETAEAAETAAEAAEAEAEQAEASAEAAKAEAAAAGDSSTAAATDGDGDGASPAEEGTPSNANASRSVPGGGRRTVVGTGNMVSGLGYNHYGQANKEIYERFRKFKMEREGINTEEEKTVGTFASVEGEGARVDLQALRRPRIVSIDGATEASHRSSTDGIKRDFTKPSFASLAYAVAAHQLGDITIDGDLADWGERDPRKAIVMQYNVKDEKPQNPINLWMRWSKRGLYFCYHITDCSVEQARKEPIIGNKIYEGHVCEIWLDSENLRRGSMVASPNTQQFVLMPFGNTVEPDSTLAEVGRGTRGIAKHTCRFYSSELGQSAYKDDGQGGYYVEGLISNQAIARPVMRSGRYIAINFSINKGYDYGKTQQWSMSKADIHKMYDRPDTWGDVLLLGNDGSVRFTSADDPAKEPDPVAVGGAVGVLVKDLDRNVNSRHRDKILAKVRVKGTPSYLYVILEETSLTTGYFWGSFATQSVYLPIKGNTLGVRGGDVLEIEYDDAHTEFGRSDRTVQATMKIHHPVYKLSRADAKETAVP